VWDKGDYKIISRQKVKGQKGMGLGGRILLTFYISSTRLSHWVGGEVFKLNGKKFLILEMTFGEGSNHVSSTSVLIIFFDFSNVEKSLPMGLKNAPP